MKYEKPEAETVVFDHSEFMAGSMINGSCTGYTESVGHTCTTYTSGSSCDSWSTPSFGGGSCQTYNGHKCYVYTDSSHTTPCREYGISCGKF